MRSRFGLRALATAFLVVATASSSQGVTPAQQTKTFTSVQQQSSPNPVITSGGGVSNVTFYYGGTVPLVGTGPAELAAQLGRPAIVATTVSGNGHASAKAIHSIGAKAYRYIQFYWAPATEPYEGIDLSKNPSWAFCRTGSTKSVGRTTNDGTKKWYFIDTNEKAVRARISTILAGFKKAGWDGLMFDRGEAATQHAADTDGKGVWYRKSSCTNSPYQSGRRFSDAYVSTLGLADKAGLKVMMNNGKSPFDPVTPMRPNPSDADCQQRAWKSCTFSSDIWSKVDLVINETAARPTDELWSRTYSGNKRSERDAAHGKRTVGLVTTATLGGEENQTRSKVFYQWSRIKLFNLPVAVNTGDDKCAGASDKTICNRYGTYPELVNTKFGGPVAAAPTASGCVSGSTINCVWMRQYAKGVNVINVTSGPRSQHVSVGKSCRYVFDVYSKKPLANNQCVQRLRIRLPAWSGRPLRFKTTKW